MTKTFLSPEAAFFLKLFTRRQGSVPTLTEVGEWGVSSCSLGFNSGASGIRSVCVLPLSVLARRNRRFLKLQWFLSIVRKLKLEREP